MTAAGLKSGEDATRGLDHGVFIPFTLIYPDADVRLVQLSLQEKLDAAAHLQIGRALAPLRDEGVLIVASGMSYHNMRHFMENEPRAILEAEAFDLWLNDTLTHPDATVRSARLTEWRTAPGAVASHPRPEHLLPLMVAAGAAELDSGVRYYNDRIFGKPISGFRFG